MDSNQLFEITRLPIKSKQISNIPKNSIYPLLKKPESKNLLKDIVQSIYLISVLNERTTNLSIYESEKEYFNEIFIIHVLMREDGQQAKLFNILALVFPYPIIAVFNFKDNSSIYTGKYEKKLVSEVPSVKLLNTYSSRIYTNDEMVKLFAQMQLNPLTQKNFKDLYLWIQENILGDNLFFKDNNNQKANLLSAETHDEIRKLEKDIDRLKKELKKEEQINKIIPLQFELNNKKNHLSELLEKGD